MGIAFGLIATFCWAMYNLFLRRGRDFMDPGAGYLLTLILNVLGNFLFTLLPLPGAGSASGGRLALVWFILAGLCNTLLGRTLFFEALFTLGPSRASAWKNASPLYTLIAASFLLGERPGTLAVVGILVTLMGMLALAREQMACEEGALAEAGGGGRFGLGRDRARGRAGLLLGIGSGVAFASGIMLRKAGLNLWPDAAWGSFIGALSAFLGWFPFSLRRGEPHLLVRADRRGLGFFFLAGVASSLAQLLIFLSLRLTPSAVTHALTTLEPVFTMMLSGLLLGSRERLTAATVRAVAVICAGVTLVAL